ncbi:MAG: winged helix-turn-helix domain-containing protein [Gammaproteobacteria bacterium]
MKQGKLYTFQEFVLDVDNACLRQGQERRALRPKAFDLLRYLVERPGQLVPKDELFQALWPHIVVDGATLTGCIRAIRTVLNDDAKRPRFIETIPTRGYRFIGQVASSQHSVVSREEESQNAKVKMQKSKRKSRTFHPSPWHPTPSTFFGRKRCRTHTTARLVGQSPAW